MGINTQPSGAGKNSETDLHSQRDLLCDPGVVHQCTKDGLFGEQTELAMHAKP